MDREDTRNVTQKSEGWFVSNIAEDMVKHKVDSYETAYVFHGRICKVEVKLMELSE